MSEQEPNAERPKDEFVVDEIEGTGELRPGEYEEWVGRVLARGLDPCLIVQDEQGREIDKWGNVVGPDARR